MAKTASGSNAKIVLQPELEWGVKPASPTNAVVLTNVNPGESLNATAEKIAGNTLTGYRGQTDVRNGTISVGGTLPADLSVSNIATDLIIYGSLGKLVQTEITVGGQSKFKKVYTRNSELPSFYIEKAITDKNAFYQHSGCKVNSLQFTAEAGNSMITLSAEILGKDVDLQPTSFAPAALVPVHRSNNGIDAVLVEEGGSSSCYSNVTFTITNGITQDWCLGQRYVTDLPIGAGDTTGTITLHFRDSSIFNKWLSETQTDLRIKTQLGNDSVEYYFPKIQFDGTSEPNIDSKDSLSITYNFTAILDIATGTDVIVTVINSNDIETFLE